MKLGLLVVVAVAVLLPSFSESRIVSKCELKDKLGKVIRLPRTILAIIVCEVNRISHLNTSLVNVLGKRTTTTLKPTVVTTPSTTAVTLTTTGATTLTSTNSATTDLTDTTTTASATTTTTSTAITTTTTVTTTSPAITNSTISSVNTTLVSNSASGMKRRKRHAHSSSEEEIGQIGGGVEDSSEEENLKPSSLGLYGLFQLPDNIFCNSGLRPSRNVCRTSCNSFTDNNITDDIACFINTGHWRNIVRRASHSCLRNMNFLRECK
ncbi:integumentary mucin C.1-like [Simochromis diagramma]|uniref:integumentary mucin C.1-like n=1 Tax=Simochromis diagramma TaxID=43689 RepID=UPI001A7EC6CC|nr:integumentary mucin C.1-like [Simochromis diagramma]